MNCNEASELLAAAVLGDLGRDEQRAVHAHLAGCDRCLEEERELFASLHLLRAHAGEEPGKGLHDTVMARAAEASNRRVGLLTRTLLTAAATALIVVGLQTALESWRPAPDLSPSGPVISGAALLEGTLFDRRRNVPEDLRRFKQSRRRGDTPRPLDL